MKKGRMEGRKVRRKKKGRKEGIDYKYLFFQFLYLDKWHEYAIVWAGGVKKRADSVFILPFLLTTNPSYGIF